MLKRGLVLIFFATLLLSPVIYNQASADEPTQTASVIISAVRTGGADTKGQEFVELYNTADIEVAIGGWKIKYTAGGTSGTGTTKYTVPENTVLAPAEFFLAATQSYITANPELTTDTMTSGLSDDGGHIILTDGIGAEIDRVGWGSAQYPKISAAAAPSVSGQSLKRCSENDAFMNSGNNSFDFALVSSPMHFLLGPPCGGSQLEEDDTSENVAPGITCEGVIVTEILPNAAGQDGGNEFIELYNPTGEVISLQGCSLQTTANSKIYAFGEIEIQPSQYAAFYDSQTGLTLPNAAGGTVWLLSPTEELQAITYPGELEDDVSWALFGYDWQYTYQATPGSENILLASKPCPTGELRNPETNRCYDPFSYTYMLKPCLPGEERNPETNRCRKIGSNELVPCKPGQERNPETNRCRTTGSNGLSPCAAGQYRNPETNRCKKLPAGEVAGITTVKDVESADISSPIQWGVAGVVSLGAIGFGIYEWRHDIFNVIRRLRNRI